MTDDTQLLRQVHPSWIVGETISLQTFSSQTFKPTKKDEGLLSTYNGDQFEPDEAYIHYTEVIQLPSAGVVAVTPGECAEVPLEIIADDEPFQGHCSIDYRPIMDARKNVERAAKRLKKKAQERGWLYKVGHK